MVFQPAFFLICLTAFGVIAAGNLDTPLSLFIGLWIGTLNFIFYILIFGLQEFGWGIRVHYLLEQCLLLLVLLTGNLIALIVIGGIFVVEIASSAIQMFGWKFLKRPILPLAPLHNAFLGPWLGRAKDCNESLAFGSNACNFRSLAGHDMKFDKNLLILIIAFVFVGLVAIADASAPQALNAYGDKFYFLKSQLMWAGIGIVAMFVVSKIHYSIWEKVATPFFFVSIGFLLLVLTSPFEYYGVRGPPLDIFWVC